jgi:hypothetical protein
MCSAGEINNFLFFSSRKNKRILFFVLYIYILRKLINRWSKLQSTLALPL